MAKAKKKSPRKRSVGIPKGTPRLLHAPTSPSEPKFSPARRAKEREAAQPKETLSEALLKLAATTPRARGKIGAIVSGGLSGAALGATLGEAIGKARKRRAKSARQSEKWATERLGDAALDIAEARERQKKG